MSPPDVLVGYCEAWDTPLRTSKHRYIERLAARGHRVLYLEVPTGPLVILRRPREFFASELPRVLAGPREVAPNIWALSGVVPLPYHRPPWGLFDHQSLNAANQAVHAPAIKRALAALGFRDLHAIVYFPLLLPVLEQLAPRRVLFHMVDEWQGLPSIPLSMAALTRAMLRRAEVTVVSARRLYDRYAGSGREVRLLRHGADLALFEPVSRGAVAPDPALAARPGVRIGYYGALHKIDWPLVAAVAGRRPDWSFFFIGPAGGKQGLGAGAALPANVHLLPACPSSALPAALAAFDAVWMPFVVNELTHSMCPIKLYEVLSAGLPTVVSELDESRVVAGALARFAVTADEHARALEQAVADKDPARRLARAEAMARFDWDVQFEVFSRYLFGGEHSSGEESDGGAA